MKNILIIISLFSTIVYSQEANSKLYFYGGFQFSNIKIEESILESGNISTRISNNPKLEIGYEYYNTNQSGVSFNLGFSSLTKHYKFKLDKFIEDTLLVNGLTWNEDIRIPNDQHYLTLRLSYVYQFPLKEKNKMSFLLGGLLRFGFYVETYSASNMFFENEEEFSQAIGPQSYESFGTYDKLIINPNLSFRYERITKSNNSFGLSIDYNVPLLKSYKGHIDILPEYDDLKSRFYYYSRGGFIGFTLFYGIGFGSVNLKKMV